MKRYIFYAIFILIYNGSMAQQDGSFAPEVIPPSPEAASLGQYVDVPVSLYTGTPSIQIPICNVTERNLSLPVSLSYHASGNKVETVANRTGLGWVLNAGGAITRSVNGLPDEYGTNGFLSVANGLSNNPGSFYEGTNNEKYQRYDAHARNCSDAQPDQFYFNFAGYSGQFAFNWDGEIVIGSGQHLIIEPVNLVVGALEYIQGWEVTTTNGTVFLFTEKEVSELQDNTNLNNCASNLAPYTAWYLSKVTSVNGESWIDLIYEDYTLSYDMLVSESKTHNPSSSLRTSYTNILEMEVKGKYLTEITSSSGQSSVSFVKGGARIDNVSGTNLFELGSIEVKNSETTIKQFDLEFNTGNNRLMLASLQEKSMDGLVSKPAFQFEYFAGTLPPYTSKKRDHWGYYNNNTENTLVPPMLFPVIFSDHVYLDGADREPDLTRTKMGVLSKITYPTGGETTFEYELHDFSFEQGRKLVGFESITRQAGTASVGSSASGSNNAPPYLNEEQFTINGEGLANTDLVKVDINVTVVKNSQDLPGGLLQPYVRVLNSTGTEIENWGANQNDYGHLLLPNGTYTVQTFARLQGDNASASFTWDDNGAAVTPRKKAGGLRVSEIIKYDGIDHANDIIEKYEYTQEDNGTTISSGVAQQENFIYSYTNEFATTLNPITYITMEQVIRLSSNRSALGTTKGSFVGYKEVKTIYGATGGNGMMKTTYTTAADYPDQVYTTFPFRPTTNQDYARGLMKSESYFDSNGLELERKEYDYQVSSENIPAIKVDWAIPGDPPFGADFLERYALGGYSLGIGYVQNTALRQFTFEGNGQQLVETTFEYDPVYLQMKRSVTTNSQQENIISEYNYATDYTRTTFNGAIGEMQDKNMVSNVIEQVILIDKDRDGNGNVRSAVKNEYFLDGLLPRQKSVYTALLESPVSNGSFNDTFYEPRFNFHGYDSYGNILSYSKDNDPAHIAFVWGYSQTRPIAQAIGAEKNEVFYIGFEGDPTAIKNGTNANTGEYYVNGSFDLSFVPPNTKKYLLSYWRYNNSTGIWEYLDGISYTGPTTITGSRLDDIRIYPEGALMSSYTYQVGYGKSSEIDPNGTRMYYEYDNIGRLIRILDRDGNILTQNEYNYGSNQN